MFNNSFKYGGRHVSVFIIEAWNYGQSFCHFRYPYFTWYGSCLLSTAFNIHSRWLWSRKGARESGNPFGNQKSKFLSFWQAPPGTFGFVPRVRWTNVCKSSVYLFGLFRIKRVRKSSYEVPIESKSIWVCSTGDRLIPSLPNGNNEKSTLKKIRHPHSRIGMVSSHSLALGPDFEVPLKKFSAMCFRLRICRGKQVWT